MDPIKFTVPAIPIAQPRNRAISLNGQGRSVPPPKSHAIHDFKASVRQAFVAQSVAAPVECPLSITLVFVMPRPKAMCWATRAMPRAPYAVAKNDWDNLGKGVCDALNGLAYRDDGQIARAVVERWVASGDEQPHVEITIEELAHG